MGTCSFQIRNETFLCKVKSKIPDFERGKSRDCAETYIGYVAQARPPRLSEQARDGGQGIPLIDAACPVVALAKTEDCKKGPFLDGN
jgi:hypothetical protein